MTDRARPGDRWPHTELYDVFHHHWGHPEAWWSFSKQGREGFQVVLFKGRSAVTARLVTHGLSSCPAADDVAVGFEALLVLPSDMGGVAPKRAADFLADIGAWAIRHSVRPVPGTIARTSLCPWPMDALLFDTPLGEDEALEEFDADDIHLQLLWVKPVYASEARVVEEEGLDAFDVITESADLSVVDVRRPPFV